MEDPDRIARDQAACEAQINATDTPPGVYCEGTFDTWLCWPPTPANSTAYASCPDFVPGFSAALMAHKECTGNGTWWQHPETGRPWSNYTTCIEPEDVRTAPSVRPPARPRSNSVLCRAELRRHRGCVPGGVQRVAGGAAAVARHPVLLQEPALRAHHGAHEPVRVVRGEQRAVARLVRAGGGRARRAGRLARLVPRAQRRAAVRDARHLHVDAVRGALPAHGARVRVRLRAAAAARAAARGLGAAAAAVRGVRGAPPGRRRPAVLDGRGDAAARAGRGGRRRRAAQRGLPVQHRARAVHQAARGRRRRRPRGRPPAALGHRAARAARHLPAGAAARPAVPADAVPTGAHGILVARIRVRVGADDLAAGALRGGAVLLLQRRGARAAAAPLAGAHVPAARQLRHGDHGLVRAVGGGWRARRRGQGVTGGGRGHYRWRGGWSGRGGGRGRGGAAAKRTPHPLRVRRQRRRSTQRCAPAVSSARPCCLLRYLLRFRRLSAHRRAAPHCCRHSD